MAFKTAIFVEGQTESIFTECLIEHLAGNKDYSVTSQTLRNNLSAKSLRKVETDNDFYFLIFDCGGDDSVKSRIKDNYETLKNSNYDLILGLRDLYSKYIFSELGKVLENLYVGLNVENLNIEITVAVMELETWFLKETNHLEAIDNTLTIDYINDNCGIDLENVVAESITTPAILLKEIFQLVSLDYNKKQYEVRLITQNLDFDRLYLELKEEINALGQYINAIDEILVA